MPLERPCSPGHCLGMLNEYMRTDILRRVHQAIHARLDQRGTRSPLLILIESLEDVLGIFAGDYHMEGIRRLCTKSLSLTVITEENEACLISFSWIFPFKQFSLTHQSSN